MSWAKLDDSFPDHPKVAGLSDRAFRIHVSGICYASRLLTDGRIPAAVAKRYGRRVCDDLVRSGLWLAGDLGDYQIHDFLEYNPSRSQVEEERRKARERRAKGARTSPDVRANDQATFARTSSAPTRPLPESPSDSKNKPLGPPASPNGPRKRDEIFEAIVEVCEWKLETLTPDARGRANSATKQLRAVQATAPLIRGFRQEWEGHYPGATLTPQAITSNWPDYMAGKLWEEAKRGRR